MEVYVIRHTPVAVGKDTCYGQSDVSLAESFPKDFTYYENQLPSDFDVVYCSPLKRCTDLASALKCEKIRIENALLEMNFGDWENKKWEDLNEAELNNWMADFVNVKTPNGENLLELAERVKLFLDELRNQQHKKVLLITTAFTRRCVVSSSTVFDITYLGQSPWTPFLAGFQWSCPAMPHPCTTPSPWLWTDCCSTGCTSSSVTGAEEAS